MSTPYNPQDPNQQPGQPLPEGYELRKKKKPFYQRLGCLIPLAIVVILIVVIAVNTGGDDETGTTTDTTTTTPAEQDAPAEEGAPAEEEEEEEEDVPTEYRSALRSAQNYLRSGNFSQEGLYNQLTSQFDQHTPEAARYAVENVDADWNQEALDAARSYQETMNMSPAAIYDQLTSQFELYTPEQAQYAVDNLN